MELRRLGNDGPWVPVMCLGTWPISGGMGEVSDKEAVAVLHAALETGASFLDSAESHGHSERLIGRALRGKRHEAFISTKVSFDYSEKHIRDVVEASLKSLETDYIDLFQLHVPKPEWPIDQVMSYLNALLDEGKFRYIGVSNFGVRDTREAMRHASIQSSQPMYNMLRREAERWLLPFCQTNGIGVIVHSPLAKGLLTGKYGPGASFEKGDERSELRLFAPDNLVTAARVTSRLHEFAAGYGRTVSELAIAWTLANSAVTSTIVGAKSTSQVMSNAGAVSWKLSSSDLASIDASIGGEWLRIRRQRWRPENK